jgi:capsular exopolysaccharide synthesis family protein
MAAIVFPLTALVLVFSLLIPKTYRATARVVLADTSGVFQAADPQTVQRELATIQTLATTRSVLAQAARQLRGESVETLERNVHASVDQQANIINISATDSDPRAAAATANAVARAYLSQRRSVERAQLARDRANLVRRMENLRNAPGGAAQAGAIQERLSEISVQEAAAGSDLQLAQPARPPSTPYSPRPIRNAVFAFFAAVFMAVLVALAREHFVRRLDGPRELSRLLRLPILSSVPLIRRARGRRRRHARGRELEAYEALSASIEFQLPATKQRTILITSALSGEGKSEVTARLGQALAEAGHSTLLLDADLRRPSLHEFFPTEAALGLRGLLGAVRAGGAGTPAEVVEQALAVARVTNRLFVLASGERAARPPRLLGGDGSEAMAIFDEFSRRDFDYVLVDGPPLLGVVDAQILAQLADTVLVVARLDRLTVENVHDLRELLDRHEITALGLFVVGAEAGVPQYYLGDREAVFEET